MRSSMIPLTDTLSLIPRIKLNITISPLSHSLSPLNHWLLKSSLSSFLHSSSLSSDSDISIRKLIKRKRNDALAQGEIFIRDFRYVERIMNAEGDDVDARERRFKEWRDKVVDEMDGIELNLQGLKFRLNVVSPVSDDFDKMSKEWEEYYAFPNRGNSRREKQQPDTLVLRGVPSRWFAETRVSSKPSMLVTHTILSAFGKIRNLSVAEDDDFNKNDDEDNLVSGLHCKIVVQYEKHSDFIAAMKGLCGRSLQKEGSHLKADYEVSWEKDGFKNTKRNELLDRSTRTTPLGGGSYRSEAPRRQSEFSRYSPDNGRSKRFRD